jgi:hypothetical protein
MTPLFAVGPVCCMVPILLGLAVGYYVLHQLTREPPPPPPPRDPDAPPPNWPAHWPRRPG